jgi:4,5-dihydroxyphthalate decarboxylase
MAGHIRIPTMPKLSLTLACGDYEIVRPLVEGTIAPDGVELTVLTQMDSATRHWRMMRNGEFDAAEYSLSSYLMARDRGLPFTAIPVFLHRRFRHGFIFVNANAGIDAPKDLIGRRIGVKTFQTTAIMWLRGMLENDYGVPQTAVDWLVELDEEIEFTPRKDLRLTRLPPGKDVERMLAEGEVDAVLHSDLIDPFVEGDPRVRRLFVDNEAVEKEYFRRTGIFPIMHVMALRRDVVEANPWLPYNLLRAFEASKKAAYQRLQNPRIVPLAWYRTYQEQEQEILGDDPWEYGLGARNRKNLETAIKYSHQSGLIGREIPIDELFENCTVGRGRGERMRI